MKQGSQDGLTGRDLADSALESPAVPRSERVSASQDGQRQAVPAFRSHADEIAYLTGHRSVPQQDEGILVLAAGVIQKLSAEIESGTEYDPAAVSRQLRRVEILLEQLL